ncbi:hypothetical protein [Ruminococcus sp.]|uniref:hypothetical protein n=1 Tax=Ruminococcus sp. TaxID=41978 RepID=UPI0025DED00F|nr:hypothetical protein [Ruminococcus sp.]MCR4638624.1 hypothetical protein [Ruminococcus sp.]
MNTFKRYLSVFLIIGAVIFAIGFVLLAIDKTYFKWQMITALFAAICIYVFPMSLYLSSQASTVEIRINKSKNELVNKIDDISFNKCNRKNKKEVGKEMIYSAADKFSAWLTNPVKVYDHDEYVIVEVPKAYKKYYTSLA